MTSSGVLEPSQVAPVLFRRSAVAGLDHRCGVPQLPAKGLTGGDRVSQFFVQQRGLGGWTTSFACSPYGKSLFERPQSHADEITRLHLARRFDALAVHFHPAAGDRFGGEGPRLEKARGPEPLVDPHGD